MGKQVQLTYKGSHGTQIYMIFMMSWFLNRAAVVSICGIHSIGNVIKPSYSQ